MKYYSPADIADMRARGFDPATIAEVEQRSKATEEVARQIEAAFSGVTLGNGVGLQEAQGLDDYADAVTCAGYREADEKEDWRHIPAEALNRCHSSLSFFDAKGMRFHLPAFLLAELRGEFCFGMTFCLTANCQHSTAQFALLSADQRAAVRAFLLHIVDEPDQEFRRTDIIRALSDSWNSSFTPDAGSPHSHST